MADTFREDREQSDADREAAYAEYLRNTERRRRLGADLSWRDELGRRWTKPSDIFLPGYADPNPQRKRRVAR
jgi:hypothetical protein